MVKLDNLIAHLNASQPRFYSHRFHYCVHQYNLQLDSVGMYKRPQFQDIPYLTVENQYQRHQVFSFHSALHLLLVFDSVLPKRHTNPYRARIIANSSSCMTTELSELLTSCLTAVKKLLSSTVKRYMRDSVKI